MPDRTRHLLRRAGDVGPWVVGVIAVGALLVPLAGTFGDGGNEPVVASPGVPRRITFLRPLRSALHPRLQPTAPAPSVPAPLVAPPVVTQPPAAASATTRPLKGVPLPPGFPSPGKAYVYLNQPARTGARTVAVIGDSLTVGASPGMAAFLSDVHLRLDARVGRPTLEGVQAAASIRAAAADVVVVALGSNDSCTVAECRRRVDAVLAAIGPRPAVTWMPPAQFRPNMTAMRSAIAAAMKSRGRMTVLDWQPYLDDHPEITTTDGIHLTAEGYRLRAQVTADHVHRLLASR